MNIAVGIACLVVVTLLAGVHGFSEDPELKEYQSERRDLACETKWNCKKLGNAIGVKATCQPKEDACDGTLMRGRKFCKDSTSCSCCIPPAAPAAICDLSCLNGNCTGPDTCTCEDGWTGTICEIPICDPSCVNGDCTGPDTCTCDAGWTGNICEILQVDIVHEQRPDVVQEHVVGGWLEYQNQTNGERDPTVVLPSKKAIFTAAAIGAAAGVASAIAAIIGTTHTILNDLNNHDHLDYSKNFEMKITNNLPWALQNPVVWSKHGKTSSGPNKIGPHSEGSLAGHKSTWSFYGTEGVVAWKIHEKGLWVFVSWMVPYSNCNQMALGIYRDLPSKWIDYYMNDLYPRGTYYYCSGNMAKTRRWRQACSGVSEFCTRNLGVTLCGGLTTGGAGKFVVNFNVEPWCSDL